MEIKQLENEYSQYGAIYAGFQAEVFEVLETFLANADLDLAEVKQRKGIKTLKSLQENYTDHGKYIDCKDISEIKDIAGVRVICHCEDDVETAARYLEAELRVRYSIVTLELKGGENNHGKSSPSYRAYHLTVTKPWVVSGKTVNVSCEIQIKTVMADAWAVQDRKYLYGKGKEGETQTLTDSVATIMKGCEGLWSLVKGKASTQTGSQSADLRIQSIRDEISKHLTSVSQQTASVFPNSWFSKNHDVARIGFDSIKKPGYMQIRAYIPHAKLSVSLIQIKEAARGSCVHTFGWPIAVFLEGGKSEYAPVPDEDGIHAEILTNDDLYTDGNIAKMFDYWAINTNGAFFLLKSIFEDERKPGELFFNTRIIRITETLMYLRNLYSRMGVENEEELVIEITHGGLKGRILTASSPNRLLRTIRGCSVENKTTKISTTINQIDNDMVSVVEKFTVPLFELFDFFQLDRGVLEEIVTGYVNGKVL